jgi:hypothetical protein
MNRHRLELVEEGFVFKGDGRKPTEDYLNDIELCLQHAKYINDWEYNFCHELLGFAMISPRQQEKLGLIVRKVTSGLDLSARRR